MANLSKFFLLLSDFLQSISTYICLFPAGGYHQKFPLALVTCLMCAESGPAATQLKHNFSSGGPSPSCADVTLAGRGAAPEE